VSLILRSSTAEPYSGRAELAHIQA
jgi:hypothetical protein